MTVFLIIISIVFVILLSLFLGPLLYRIIIKKNFKKVVNRQLYSLSQEEDFLLVNNLVLDLSEDIRIHVDHLLCGDKFIYLIYDKYLFDGVEGSPEDETFFVYKNGKRKEIKNSVKLNKKRATLLSKYFNWSDRDPKILISVVVTNNDVEISELMKLNGPDDYFVHVSELAKTIKTKEYETDTGVFDSESLEKMVEYIVKLNNKSRN